MITEQADSESLRKISSLNKFFNRLSNPRLWRHFSIDDSIDNLSTSRRRRARVSSQCVAIYRDPERARHIKSLSIRIESSLQGDVPAPRRRSLFGPTALVIGRLADALSHLPALKKMELSMSSCIERPRILEMLSSGALAGKFPFRLTEFGDENGLNSFTIDFLLRQTSSACVQLTAIHHRASLETFAARQEPRS